MSDAELRRLLNFEDGDLVPNRVGRLSARQISDLEASSKKVKKYGIGIGIGLILLAVAIVAAIYVDAKNYAEAVHKSIDWSSVIGGGSVVFLILGIFAAISFWVAFMKIKTEMASVEGEVNFVKVEKRVSEKSATGSTHYKTVQVYELRVGRENFNNVPEEYLNVIREGDIYAFYYLKESRHILSAEFISKGK